MPAAAEENTFATNRTEFATNGDAVAVEKYFSEAADTDREHDRAGKSYSRLG